MISILFLAADPTDASRLRLGEEAREVQEKLQLSKSRESFVLHQRFSVRPADISQALLDLDPQIVHFSGPGSSTGDLCVEDQSGRMQAIEPDALAALFERFAGSVRCVLLNACYSEAQAQAISQNIRYVIGVSRTIDTKAAIAFSVGFYQGLGALRSVEEAYHLGCIQMRLQGIAEDVTPVLLKRGASAVSVEANVTHDGIDKSAKPLLPQMHQVGADTVHINLVTRQIQFKQISAISKLAQNRDLFSPLAGRILYRRLEEVLSKIEEPGVLAIDFSQVIHAYSSTLLVSVVDLLAWNRRQDWQKAVVFTHASRHLMSLETAIATWPYIRNPERDYQPGQERLLAWASEQGGQEGWHLLGEITADENLVWNILRTRQSIDVDELAILSGTDKEMLLQTLGIFLDNRVLWSTRCEGQTVLHLVPSLLR